ncbi:MAG: methyl-accepting chemotaxis protein [Candidatus Hydrothermarchaeales archaeon]
MGKLNFNDMKIGKKLIIGFLAVAALVLVAGLVGYNATNTIARSSGIILDEKVPIADASMELMIATGGQQTGLHAYMLGEEEGKDEYIEGGEDFQKWLAELKAMELNDEENRLVSNIEAAHLKIDEYAYEAMANSDKAQASLKKSEEDMEEMDAAGGIMLDKATEKSFSTADINLIWEQLMAVNDYLITGSQEEVEAFYETKTSVETLVNYPAIEAEHAEVVRLGEETISAHDSVAEAQVNAEEKMEEMDAAGVVLLAKAEASSFSSNDMNLIWEQLMTVNDYLITGSQEEVEAFQEVKTEVEALPNYPSIAAENAETIRLAEITIQSYNDYLSYDRLANDNMEELDVELGSFSGDLERLEASAGAEMAVAMEEADAAQRNAIVFLIATMIAGVVLAIAIGLFMSRLITKPINQIVDDSKKLGDGDLSIRIDIDSKDEIGQMAKALNDMLDNVAKPVRELAKNAETMAKGDLTQKVTVQAKGDINVLIDAFKAMAESLTGLIIQVKGSASTVSATSQELAASSEEMNATTEQVTSTVTQIASGAQSQAQQVESASAEMKSLSEMVHQISSSAQSATEMSDKTNELAQSGGEAAENASAKMKEVYTEVKSSADVVGELGEKSEKIGNIVNVITDIAEQTNLLALNAAIEAARAGDHGRGFAVVAEEVRKLAENSAKAAEQISVLIKDIQTNTDKAVKSIDKGTKEVAEGTEVVEKAMAAFEEIVTSVGEVAGKVQEISAATQEQTTAVETVVKGIDSIASAAEEAAAGTEEASAATEEQTASMEEMTASAQELANLADQLQEAVSVFKVAEDAEAGIGRVKRKAVEPEPVEKAKKAKAKVSRQKAGVKANGPKKARAEVKKISHEPVEAGTAVGEN